MRQIAARLVRCVGDAKEVARIGPDLFAAVITDVRTDGEVARTVEEWWRQWLDEPFQNDASELRVSAKVGIALFPGDGRDAESLLKNAEAALRKAKATGDKYLFYAPHLSEKMAERLALENQLRRALENQEFVLKPFDSEDLLRLVLLAAEAGGTR